VSRQSRPSTSSRTAARILRIDHAGEHGAQRIYRAQIALARRGCPELLEFLRETLAHEEAHEAAFARLMRARGVRPSGALALWAAGGWALGLVTGLLGSDAVLICTGAVERTVQAHLDAQLRHLGERDPELSAVIAAIRDEELGHLAVADDPQRVLCLSGRLLDGFIAVVTEALLLPLSLTLAAGLEAA
jgi:ubiquinone biosynthesis monooxygenase Coq7